MKVEKYANKDNDPRVSHNKQPLKNSDRNKVNRIRQE